MTFQNTIPWLAALANYFSLFVFRFSCSGAKEQSEVSNRVMSRGPWAYCLNRKRKKTMRFKVRNTFKKKKFFFFLPILGLFFLILVKIFPKVHYRAKNSKEQQKPEKTSKKRLLTRYVAVLGVQAA